MPPVHDISLVELLVGLLAGSGGALGYRHVRPNGLSSAISELRRSVEHSEERSEQRHAALMQLLTRMREDQLRTESRPKAESR